MIMPRDYFLSYYSDPFSLSKPTFALSGGPELSPHLVGIDELALLDGDIITFQAGHLVEGLRARGLALPRLVEIGQALQLASGLPKRILGQSEWTFTRWLPLTHLATQDRVAYLEAVRNL